jgi:hypothetical protein
MPHAPAEPRVDPYARVIQIAEHVDRAYAESEATRIVGEASANLDGAVKIANEQYGDPSEFAANAAGAAEQVYNKALQSSRSPRVRELVEARLADNYNKTRNGIAFDTLRKEHDVIAGNWEKQKADAIIEFPDLTEDQKDTKIKEIAIGARNLARRGILKAKDAELDIAKFQRDAWRQDASSFASNKPIEFQDAVDQGWYKNKLTGEDIRLASEIAERRINAQQAKDARFLAQAAKQQEDEFYNQAKNKTLDENNLRNAARTFGWSKEKVDSIMRVQLGVKESSPYADQLIAQAARLDDPINPTTKMVQDAKQRLDKLVENNQVSRDSVEYNRVTRELRIIEQMASRSNSPVNHEKSLAKTYIRDLLNSKAPDMDVEEKRKILGTYNTEINRTENVQNLDAIKKKFEKDMDNLGKQVVPGKDAVDKLRGLAR